MALSTQSQPYPIVAVGLSQRTDERIRKLFHDLINLHPMEKNGPMNGRCERETNQMERFLRHTFGFRNIPNQYIVHGVKAFQLERYPHKLDPKTTIQFPITGPDSFEMTIEEIMNWQRSYRVYADKSIPGMSKEFLFKALHGHSEDGEEAFRMKFVVRISTCPILMEFDAKVISRQLNEEWPNRIKLVSLTGIDFAGRKHDVFDILKYVANWDEIYEIDRRKRQLVLMNERDFRLKRDRPSGKLHEDRLLEDLKRMARLRLRACDLEGVQIVVETGIGLGVFAGANIGIDETVRIASAIAIRTVLEEDGSMFKNIRAIIFALPIMHEHRNIMNTRDTFSTFVEQFKEPEYRGRIPVLIADQDMHRLTVAIARRGLIVSQLNPADSHGVFGEYWQNRGPAVEEKLALTTVGLLVQHHLINSYVLNISNYHLVEIDKRAIRN